MSTANNKMGLGENVFEVPINHEPLGIVRRTELSNLAGSHKISVYQHNGIVHYPVFKEGTVHYKTYGDRKYPIVIPSGDPEVKFMLSNPIEAMQFEFLQRMSDLKVFPFNEDAPLLVIYEPDSELIDEQMLFEIEDKALAVLKDELTSAYLKRDFAILFNLHAGNDLMVETNLRRMVKEEPQRFLSAWENPNRDIAVLAHKAIALNIINRDHNGMYKYGQSVLGKEVDDVVDALVREVSLTPLIRNAIKTQNS